MPKVTVLAYAEHRRISERSVRRYLASGDIPEKAIIREGRLLFIDRAKADKALGRNNTTRKELLGQSESAATPTKKNQAAVQAVTDDLSFHEARTVKERAKAALLKIELAEKEGSLVDAEQVRISAFNKARGLRDALLNIPHRVSPILAAETDQMKVAEILTTEIRQALEELTKQ